MSNIIEHTPTHTQVIAAVHDGRLLAPAAFQLAFIFLVVGAELRLGVFSYLTRTARLWAA